MGTSNLAPRGSSTKNSRKPKPVIRLEPRRVELVGSTYQPSKADHATANVARGGRPQTNGTGRDSPHRQAPA